ncbi:F-box only protein 6-like [Haliotis rufescens]|uniref:F-box only protein 6-like n=1 Tax=Haliotis rufescens TaxID=6454 RepID=UPI00201F4A87|nr:F-box only protein 6-like [Haliotis rufescens]XP_046371638.2 F-box only protein 6-like [Haliotis rufescens]XP_046371647.2 F-box only protein 6-like [Haliotis rufescens]
MGSKHSSGTLKNTSCLLYEIPDDLIIEILIQVPARDIVKNCVRVCHQLRDIIASPTLWKRKCELGGKYIPRFVKPEDFKKIFFFNPYTRNLIKNPCAQEGLQHWKVMQNGGSRFKVQTESHGSQDVALTNMNQEWSGPIIKKWATSYGACEKVQTIDLWDEGVVAEVLDQIKPPIYISEWYTARTDCACHYELEVNLLSGDRKQLDKFTFEDDIPQWTAGEWTKVEHVFPDYKAGVRFIKFRHLGVDKQFWAGHYGPKFTLSTVKFTFEANTGS